MQKLSKLQKLLFLIIIFYASFVRLQNLGYSDYQGDEILTLDFTQYYTQETFSQYLLRQDKGPLQFVINKTVYTLTGNMNEATIRFPYCLAGIAFVVAIFFLSRELLWSNWGALLTAGLAATNGLFISFSRITQYQSFVQLLTVLSIWMLIKKRRILAGLLLGLGFLFHYDALVALAFVLFYLGKRFWRTENKKAQLKEWAEFFIPLFLVSAPFYLPFLLKPSADSTSSYLVGRLLGSGFMPRTIQTIQLMKFYIPVEIQYTLMLLSCVPVGICLKSVRKNAILWKYFIAHGVAFAFISIFALSATWFKPRASTLLFYTISAIVLGVLFFNKQVKARCSSLFVWFLAGSGFYLFFHKTPRTHVYALLIPMFILTSWGVSWLTKNHPKPIRKIFKVIFGVSLVYLLLLSLCYNHRIFMEKSPEYLWGDKVALGRKMVEVKKDRYSKIDGVFGFPQNRYWEEIAAMFESGELIGTYATNEKARIPEFYLHKEPLVGLDSGADNLILVESPVSWDYRDLKKERLGYVHLKSFNIGKHPVTVIYKKVE